MIRAVTLTIEVANASETSVNFNQITWCNISEDGYLHVSRLLHIEILIMLICNFRRFIIPYIATFLSSTSLLVCFHPSFLRTARCLFLLSTNLSLSITLSTFYHLQPTKFPLLTLLSSSHPFLVFFSVALPFLFAVFRLPSVPGSVVILQAGRDEGFHWRLGSSGRIKQDGCAFSLHPAVLH